MTYAGLDIGSRTIVLVEFDEGLKDFVILDTGPNPVDRCRHLLNGRTYRQVVATGYGRHLAAATLADEVGMVRRVGPRERVVFAGGGALNPCLRRLLGQKIGVELTVPEQPQVVGALGAALVAKAR